MSPVVTPVDTKGAWILAGLHWAPLDRLRLMNALLPTWLDANRQIPGFFDREPYLYGPYTRERYLALAELQSQGLVAEATYQGGHTKYFLTDRGSQRAAALIAGAPPKMRVADLTRDGTFAKDADFSLLLRAVYDRAPEFALRSLVRETVN